MAFVNDKTNNSSFSDDSFVNYNSSFIAEEYTKYVAQDYTEDNKFHYYGQHNDFGLRYNHEDDEFNIFAEADKVLEITKKGNMILTMNASSRSAPLKIINSNNKNLFTFAQDGSMYMADVTELSVTDENGLAFHNDNLYASI